MVFALNVKMEKNNILMCIKLKDICRTCFSSDGTLYSIFDSEPVIITMLNSIFGTKLKKENYNKNMPSKVCESCLKKLNSFFQFRQQCKVVEEKIEKLFLFFKETAKNENVYLLKNLGSLEQKSTINQLILPNPNIFKCEGHIFLKSNENLEVPTEYRLHESLFEETTNTNELPEFYEDKYQEDNKDIINVTEYENLIVSGEITDISNVNIKCEPESELNLNNVISKSGSKTNKFDSHKKVFKSKKNSRSGLVSKLREQLKNLIPKEKNLLCLICKQSFSNARILKIHVQTHISEVKAAYVCKECGKKFNMQHNLKRHEKIHTGERPFKCNTCNKSFTQSFNFKEHMLSHNEVNGCECNVCHKIFRRPGGLREHKKKYHESLLETSHKCVICLKSFSSYLGLNSHLRVHSEDSNFECTKCQIKFSSTHFLTEHNINHHSDDKMADKEFSCSICRKIFPDYTSVIRHQRNHRSNNESFLCNTCGKSCHSKYSFILHLRRHTGERPFTCEHCNKQFISKANLIKHKSTTHDDIRRYTCDVCRKKFRQQSHLIVHKRIHTGEKPFGCEFCSKRFRVKVSADIHLRIHTGEKPYSCDNCLQAFSDPSSFKKHSTKCKSDIKMSKQELTEVN